MNPLDRLVGEQLKINGTRFRISGFDVAGRDVVIRAVAIDAPHDVVELSLPQVLEGLFHDEPKPP